MASMNRGLGRGLDALFNNAPAEEPVAASPLATVALDNIRTNPNQPRKTFDSAKLGELAASIRAQGILQPLVVRPAQEENHYELIAGERRLRAARMAGLMEVPVLVRAMSDHDALVCTLMENLQREDLNPIEHAKGIKALQEALGCNVEELAAKLGQGRSSIFHILRLLRLDEILQEDIIANNLSISHALAISTVEQLDARLALREYVFDHDLTSRATEEAASYFNAHGHFQWEVDADEPKADGGVTTGSDNAAESHSAEQTALGLYTQGGSSQDADMPAQADNGENQPRERMGHWPEISQLARDIGTALNCRTRITGTPERGSISISYESTEQLNELLQKMGITLDDIFMSPQPEN